jgi:nucleoside-diphosphate-sugar epimerase
MVDIVSACIETVGRGKIHLPSISLPGKGKERFALDCLAARKAFGYGPEIGLLEGIKRTWAGMKEHC